ncbi:S-adenosyl-L-methionine-dependent methyltransferase [Parathielavia appendiculata]|uniref:type I protein arginine methyltransferase n=1 Tax=Parathielavia appendiculata TaxID=2587402 RepID=A0AAN6TST2_9PEZI|nr:S-adenosyl-L-methionine-dependent methyltransferase [Parathielavia appendiculata]
MAEAYPCSDSESVSSSDNDQDWLNKPGEEDEDEEQEQVTVVSFFDDKGFSDAKSMLAYCKDKFDFDFLGVRDRLHLDFHGCVKLINFIRRGVKEGTALPQEITAEHLADDSLLIPVLADDALIFCLDELPERTSGQAQEKGQAAEVQNSASGGGPVVDELLQKNAQLQAELEQLAKQFTNYRLAVEQTLDKRWGVDDEGEACKTAAPVAPAEQQKKKEEEKDESAYYFESYAHTDIHETMIKDTVRTNAYRDFIYANKHLFEGKVVLDIGCGTGILSMFCARAGAARVLAVDNSAILDKARENVFRNGLDRVITCVRGRIEDVTLPVDKVDVIVSEWMGYCLLYEAMLPSVFFARDKYLKPDGLLVPSHASMWIAPVSDAEYVAENVDWWRDVYGFDMRAMQAGIYTDARMTVMPTDAVCGEAHAFRMLDLHTAKVADLVFEDSWQTTLSDKVEGLDGFLVWFDCFFGESREEAVEANLTAKEWVAAGRERVAFTTGPYDTATHWRQGLYLIDKEKAKDIEVGPGKKLVGNIRYAIPEDHARGLNITIAWALEGGDSQVQTWLLH